MALYPRCLKKQRIITRDEYNQVCLSRKASINEIMVFKFLCNTGLRASEFLSLTKCNISNGFLHIIGKGRKARTIPLNKTVMQIIEQCPALEFIESRHMCWLTCLCHRLARLSNIEAFHPHSCRHYFANELYHKGIPMHTVSRLLGHSKTEVTETVYVHWSEETLKGSTDLLE